MEFEEFIIRLIFAFKSAQKSIEEKTAAKNIPKIFIYLPYSESYLNLKKNFFNKKTKWANSYEFLHQFLFKDMHMTDKLFLSFMKNLISYNIALIFSLT